MHDIYATCFYKGDGFVTDLHGKTVFKL